MGLNDVISKYGEKGGSIKADVHPNGVMAQDTRLKEKATKCPTTKG